MLKERRLGKFVMSLELFEDVCNSGSFPWNDFKFIPVKCETLIYENRIEMKGYSPDFDIIEDDAEIPNYIFKIHAKAGLKDNDTGIELTPDTYSLEIERKAEN